MSSSTGDMRGWIDVLERYGRNGDTLLAHINPAEAKLLKEHGGSGTRNPHTGLLEFWGGDDNSAAGGPGSGDSISGGYGSDSIGAGGMSGVSDTGSDQVGADTSNGNNNGALGGGFGVGGFFSAGEDLSQESEIGERAGGVNWNDYNIANYDKAGTFGRLGQELTDPSVKASRWGAPTAQAMGFLGPAMGVLAGPAFGAMMGLGAAMGRAQSPEEQAASMAEQAATGARNSGGSDGFARRDPGPGATEGMGGQQPAQQSAQTAPAPPRLTPESWDEGGFLNRNPEVRAAVDNGTWASGYDFNRAYQGHAGVPYEQAMSFSQPDKYVEDLLATQPNTVMPYRGY